MEQITKSLFDLIDTVNNNNTFCTDVHISALRDKINTLEDLLPTIIAGIEEAERKQPLPTKDTKLLWHLQRRLHYLQRQFQGGSQRQQDLKDQPAVGAPRRPYRKRCTPYLSGGGNLSRPCLVNPRGSIWRLTDTHQQSGIQGKWQNPRHRNRIR